MESLLRGPDKKDMQRFHAAAGVVLQGEKMKVGDGVSASSSGKGKVQSSTACNIQWLLVATQGQGYRFLWYKKGGGDDLKYETKNYVLGRGRGPITASVKKAEI